VADSGRAKAADNAIRAYAAETGAVIVTTDEDFAVYRFLHEGPEWSGFGSDNTRRGELLRRCGAEFSAVVAALERGETLVEIA
jgi:predicted nuclease of predicted toxin-antitoxin system